MDREGVGGARHPGAQATVPLWQWAGEQEGERARTIECVSACRSYGKGCVALL